MTLWLCFGFFLVASVSADVEPITRIADLRSISPETAAKRLPVKITGVVTWFWGKDRREFAVQDSSGGTWVHTFTARAEQLWQGDDTVLGSMHEGSVVELEGVTHFPGYSPVILPVRLRLIGEQPSPPARPLVRSRFFNGVESGELLETQGVVLNYQPMADAWRLLLQCETDQFWVIVSAEALPDPDSLLGAEIRVKSVASAVFNTRREFIQARLMVSTPDDIVLANSRTENERDMPVVSLDRLHPFRVDPERPSRVRLQATVVFVQPGQFFYMADGARAVRVDHAPRYTVQVGDRVDVVGYVAMRRHIAGIFGARVSRIGRGAVPATMRATPSQIITVNQQAFAAGREARPMDFDGQRIEFEAQLMAIQVQNSPTGSSRKLTVNHGGALYDVLLQQGNVSDLDSIPLGSELRIRGLAQLELAYDELDQGRTMLRIVQVSTLLQSPGDVAVIRTPSWWSARHLLWVLGVGAVILLAALIWIRLLRRQVARKTAEVAEEMRKRRDAAVEFRATLRERNRLAANLHDTLLQTLGGLNYQLRACEAESVPVEQRKVNHLMTARRMVERGQADLRGTVWALRILPLEHRTIGDALRALAQQIGEGHPVTITVACDEKLPPVSEFVIGNLLLVVQEAIHNALKHARAQTISVSVSAGSPRDSLHVRIADDGVGFDLEKARRAPGHFGVSGMEERVDRLAGKFEIQTSPGHGTVVSAQIPLQPFDDQIE